MSLAPSDKTSSSEAGGTAEVRQDAVAFGQAQQASLGSGTQYNFFFSGEGTAEADAAVSIAAPVGQRDPGLPLRGRDDVLAELADGSLGAVRVVHGLGGCGKTRLALEAAWQAQQRGVEVWWVSAADKSRLVAGMQAVAHRLGITDADLRPGEAADLIWQRLSGRQKPWLLVIDNADDPQVLAGPDAQVRDGTGWLRPVQSAVAMVLVTSRDGRAASWGSWCYRHPLGMLPTQEAVQVLTDYAGRQAALGSEADAAALAERLGCLPLALKIAGSYLAESAAIPAAFSVSDTIRTYRHYQEEVEAGHFDVAFPAPGGELTAEQARGLIGRTWELTLDLLEARQLPEARQILRLLSCFADAPVPHELVLIPEMMSNSPLFGGITGPRVWQVLQALAGFGLIDLTGSQTGGVAVSQTRLHPLVRDTSRPRPGGEPDELPAYLELAARLLYRAAGAEKDHSPRDPARWPMWQLLAPHVLYIFNELTATGGYPDDAVKDAASAASLAAQYLDEQGLHAQAEALQRAVLAVRLRLLGPDHPDTLSARHEVAYAMAGRGNHAEALTEFQRLLTDELRVLGPDDRKTLIDRTRIAIEMAELGDYGGALDELRRLLANQVRVLGPDHRDTLITRHEIAYAMAAQGDHAGALAEYRSVLADKLRVLDPGDRDTLVTRFETVRMIEAQGDHATALDEYGQLLPDAIRVLGPCHPLTLATRRRRAREMTRQGDYAGALDELRQLLADQVRVLGSDHRDTLLTRHEIAYVMAAQGDHDGALDELRQLLADELRVLGPDHLDALATRHDLAYEMAAQGDHGGALDELRQLLADELRVLGPDHRLVLATRRRLATELAVQGRDAEALDAYRKLLADQVRVLGPDHPDTRATARSLESQDNDE